MEAHVERLSEMNQAAYSELIRHWEYFVQENRQSLTRKAQSKSIIRESYEILQNPRGVLCPITHYRTIIILCLIKSTP